MMTGAIRKFSVGGNKEDMGITDIVEAKKEITKARMSNLKFIMFIILVILSLMCALGGLIE